MYVFVLFGMNFDFVLSAMENDTINNNELFKTESARCFIEKLGVKMNYLQACISSLKIEVLRYEMRQIKEQELRENVEKVFEKIMDEVNKN